MTPPPSPARGVDPEARAQGEPTPEWLRANIKPRERTPEREGRFMGLPVSETLRGARAAGPRILWPLVALGIVIVGGMAVTKYGPPEVTTAAHASADATRLALLEQAVAAQAKASERQESVIASATVALNANTAALSELRALLHDIPERVRALEIKVGK